MRVLGSGEQLSALDIGFQHHFARADGAAGGFLRHIAKPGAGALADGAAIDMQFAGDKCEQRGFAGAIAANQPDTAARVHHQAGVVQQGAAGDAVGDVVKDQEAHSRSCSLNPGGLPTPHDL